MIIRGGQMADVHRPVKDRHGDQTECHVATVTGCVLDPTTTRALDDGGEVTHLRAVLWVPRGGDVRQRDRVVVGGDTYRVLATSLDHNSPATGHSWSHFRVDLEAVT